MYPMYIRIERENGLHAAFQFWKLPAVVARLDKVMVDFLNDLNDHDKMQKEAQNSLELV